MKAVSASWMTQHSLDGRPWTTQFNPSITHQGFFFRVNQPLPLRASQPSDGDSIPSLDELANHPSLKEFQHLDIPLGRALAPYISAVARESLGLLRQAYEISEAALNIVKPHVVGFSHISSLADKRLAWQCHQRGIPVVCYQHGGTYGTHDDSPAELCDYAYADFFLSYGTRVQPNSTPIIPLRAKIIPTGSARIARLNTWPSRVFKSGPRRILWIGEASFRNTIGGTFIFEDTMRFSVEKTAFSLLSQSGQLHITYRPLASQLGMNGTVRWLSRSSLPRIDIDAWTPMEELIQKSDLIIIDSASSTTWFESLVLKKPVILYCDPHQTWMTPLFKEDLDQVLRWHKSIGPFLEDLKSLTKDPTHFIEQIQTKVRPSFLERYIIGPEGHHIPDQVLAFLFQFIRRKTYSLHPHPHS
jgi:hypothetical protein